MLQSCTDPKRGNGATFGRAILDPPNNFHAEIRRGLSAAPSKHLFPFSAVLIYSLLGRKFSARQNSAGSLSTPGTAALRSWRGSAGAREMRAKAAQEPRSAGGARRGGCGSAGECRGLIPGAASSTVSPLCGVCVCGGQTAKPGTQRWAQEQAQAQPGLLSLPSPAPAASGSALCPTRSPSVGFLGLATTVDLPKFKETDVWTDYGWGGGGGRGGRDPCSCNSKKYIDKIFLR